MTDHKKTQQLLVAPQQGEIRSFDDEHAEQRLDELDELVYVSDPETYEVLYLNSAIKKKSGEAVGDKCYHAFVDRSTPCPYCTNPLIFGENLGNTHVWEFRHPQDQRTYRSMDRAIRWVDGRMARLVIIRDITGQRKAEDELRTRMDFENALTEISHIMFRGGELNRDINKSLSLIGRVCNASRASLFRFSKESKCINNTHEWCRKHVSPHLYTIQKLPFDTVPWWMERMNRGKIIHIPNVDHMPPEAAHEKDIIKRQGIKACLVLPVYVKDEPYGFVAIDDVEKAHSWKEHDIAMLRVCSEIIGSAIQNHHANDKLRTSEQRLERALDGANLGLWDWNVQSGDIFVNDRLSIMVGYKIGEIRQNFDTWQEMTHPEDLQTVQPLLKAHLEGRTPFYESEYRMRTKSGQWVWFRARGKVMERAQDGSPVRVVGTLQDITDRKWLQERNARLSRKLISLMEEGRVRLSRELHDELGQQIGAMVLQLGCLKPDLPPGHDMLDELETCVSNISDQLRRVCRGLRPVELERLGLTTAIEHLVRDFNEIHNLTITSNIQKLPRDRISHDAGINIYRICQESLNNIAQHAEANSVQLTLTYQEQELLLEIKDNGRGFSRQEIHNAKGLGLPGMKERATLCRGLFDIHSEPGHGTHVSLRVPLG